MVEVLGEGHVWRRNGISTTLTLPYVSLPSGCSLVSLTKSFNKLINVYNFLSSVSHSNKLIEPRKGVFGTAELYSQMLRSTADNLGLQPIIWRVCVCVCVCDGRRDSPVGLSPYLWDLMLPPGNSVRIELNGMDTQLVSQRTACCGGNHHMFGDQKCQK